MSGPAKFRKRPVVIEAMQWDGDEFGERIEELIEWTDQLHTTDTGRMLVRTLFMALRSDDVLDVFDYDDIRQRIKDGYTAVVWDKLHDCWVNVATGDWIIKGVQGEFYPCRAEVFAETYEAADQ